MKKIFPAVAITFITGFTSCHKASQSPGDTDDQPVTEQQVLTDFTNNVALSSYLKLSIAAASLNTAIQTLDNTPTDDNLQAARNDWKSMREIWEQSEGFLFGPVEDNDYDPNMDTWPTDYTQMDSLLASSNPLEVSDIQNLTLSLRGYHPIEYIIFGDHGSRKAADITARQKKYMISLSADLTNTCNALYLSWSSAPVNFAQQVITAGTGSSKYTTRQDIFMALAGGMIDICDEVGGGKMKEPYNAKDPQLVESPYSGNSLIDFKNNIIGAQNVYLGVNGGKGIKDIVAAKNKALDNKLQGLFTAAINSFDGITVTYEQAILSQRVQSQQTMDAVIALKESLESDLVPFIQQNIKD
ncbi:MAG TPA: imelysin family protein [Chitinophagaceae bacterium]|nr:imelysin family protein [Chitinophagaceae bacterium]